jgi:hypothetical protein
MATSAFGVPARCGALRCLLSPRRRPRPGSRHEAAGPPCARRAHLVNLPSLPSSMGFLTTLPAAVASALGGAPWWAVGVILLVGNLAVPMTGLVLEHVRRRKGDAIDEEFTLTLGEIVDPERRIQAIINYRQATGAASAPQPPPEPPPGSLPPPEPSGGAESNS